MNKSWSPGWKVYKKWDENEKDEYKEKNISTKEKKKFFTFGLVDSKHEKGAWNVQLLWRHGGLWNV
jgi:hypothetical protein